MDLSDIEQIMKMLCKVSDDKRATHKVKESIQVVADFLIDCLSDNNEK
nr:hypothetical protein [Clostridium botulinum]